MSELTLAKVRQDRKPRQAGFDFIFEFSNYTFMSFKIDYGTSTKELGEVLIKAGYNLLNEEPPKDK